MPSGDRLRAAAIVLACAACDRTCASKAGSPPSVADAAPPKPVVLASRQAHPRSVVVRDGFAYFTVYEDGALRRTPVRGGETKTLASDIEDATGLALDDAFAYVTSNTSRGSVVRIPRGGGEAKILVEELDHPTAIVVDGKRVVFATASSVKTVGTEGGAVDTIAEGPAPSGVAVADGEVFYSVYHAGIVGARRGKGPARVVFSGLAFPAGIAITGDRVLVACTGDGTLRSFRFDGSDAAVLARRKGLPTSIAVDPPFVYYTDGAGAVLRVGVSAREAEPDVFATGQTAPDGIAVDATHVYWVTRGGGELVSAAKP